MLRQDGSGLQQTGVALELISTLMLGVVGKLTRKKKKTYFVIFFHFPTGNEGVPDNDLNLLKQSKTSLTAVNEA